MAGARRERSAAAATPGSAGRRAGGAGSRKRALAPLWGELFPLQRQQHLWLIGIFLLALACRGAHLWGQARSNPFFHAPTMDERKHHEWAAQLAAGQGLGPRPYFRAPGYVYLLAVVYKACGPSVLVGRFVGIVLGSITCYLIALLGVVLGGFRVAAVAGVLAAVYWPFVHFDGLLLTVVLETFLNVLLLLLLVAAAIRPAPWLVAAAGVTWGLSVITRPTVLTLAPVIVVWLWLVRRGNFLAGAPPARNASPPGTAVAPRPGRRFLLHSALLFAAAGLAILPVTIRNRVSGGEWVLVATNGGVNFYIGNNPHSNGMAAVVPGTRPDWEGGYEDTHRIAEQARGRALREQEVSDYWYDAAWAWIRSDPAAWLRLTARKFALFWSPAEIPNNQSDQYFAALSDTFLLYRWCNYPLVAVLGLAGLGASGANARRWLLPLAYAVLGIATTVAFFCPGRYRLPVVPVLILLAAAGLVSAAAAWRTRRVARLAMYAAAVLLAAAALWANRMPQPFWDEHDSRAHHDIGNALARSGDGGPHQQHQVLEHLRTAAALLPADPTVGTSYAYWLDRYGQSDAAGREFARIVAAAPAYAEAHLLYGEWLAARREFEPAARAFETAARLQPWGRTHQASLVNLAMSRGYLGQIDGAVAALREALRRDPHDPHALQAAMGVARVLRKSGRAAESVELLEGVARQRPDDLEVLRDLGATYTELGRRAEAVQVARRAAQVCRAAGDAAGAADFAQLAQALEQGAATRPATAPAAARPG